MKDWVGWQEVKVIYMKNSSNAVRFLVIEDFIIIVAFLCQDAVMVDQYPRNTSRCKE